MRKLHTKHLPQPNELWLSRPPYLLIARIVEVDVSSNPGVVSYELHDEDGCILEHISHASLDEGWWHAFQPMPRHYG